MSIFCQLKSETSQHPRFALFGMMPEDREYDLEGRIGREDVKLPGSAMLPYSPEAICGYGCRVSK